MITKAFKALTSQRVGFGANEYVSPLIPIYYTDAKDTSGTSKAISSQVPGDLKERFNRLSGMIAKNYNSDYALYVTGLVFGTGTTPPTEDDYFVENYVSNFTYTNAAYGAVNQTDANGTYDEIIVTYNYTGSSEVTITEVGYAGKFYYNSSSSAGVFLIDRSLLNPGVTLNQGESITISLKLYHTGAVALS